MLIVQFINSLRSGGAERQLLELLKGLSEVKDIDCELIIMSKDIHYSYLDDLNIKIHFLIRESKKDPWIFPRLYRLCKKIKPDVLHSWESMCSVYAMPVVKLLGIKFVNGFIRNASPNFSVRDKTWLRAKVTFPFSDVIVANSLAGLKAYFVPLQKGCYVHNGFDIARVANLANPKEVRNRLGIGTDKIVGMVAEFSNKKDHNTFIEAAQNILLQRNDVSFIMVGDGDNMKTCRDNVLPRFRSKIKFLGKKKKVEEIVNLFSVGVLSTNASVHGEGISNSIMEYMALGKPVIATDCGGNRELVVANETGFLVSPRNAEKLATMITQLLDDSVIATRFGEAGRHRLIQEFSLEKMTQTYLDLYRSLLNR